MKNNLKKIEIEQLVWQPDKDSTPVLDHVDEIFDTGSFYGILGPNGAGKSSLVKMLLRLLGYQEGNIYLDEEGVEKKSIQSYNRNSMARLLSFLPQTIVSDVDFSVYDVVAMGREPYRKHFSTLTALDKEKIEEAMEFTNCTHLRNKSIQFLSGGERQRVMIARTIAQDTEWIILDEPVSSLDIRHQYELMNVLKRLNKEKNKTIIAILHDLNLAEKYCDRIVLMKDGRIFSSGEKSEVLTRENLKAVYDMEFEFVKMNKNGVCIVPDLK